MNGIVWVKAAGVRETATKAPVTPDTVFRIASMTKSFTAMAILKLRDEGKLSLDDPAAIGAKITPYDGRNWEAAREALG